MDQRATPSPPTHRCAICGEVAAFGFGAPGSTLQPADWYCGAHREAGERAWAARYQPSGGAAR